MTLLTEVMEQPLDPSYRDVAARRAKTAQNPPTWSRPIVLLAAIVLGAGTAVAATHLYVPPSGAQATRLLIADQIRTRTDLIAQHTAIINQVSTEIGVLQEAVLASSDPILANQLFTDELHNGRIPLTGPGMVITLTDGGGGLAEVTSENLVRDVVLQNVVSALWSAGAEAIAVADQRLTMTTAIRNAGDAVLIDLVPILGPTFTVTAIGDPAQLEIGWAISGAPEYLAMLGSEFGIRATAQIYSSLSVPSASPPVLRNAEPLEWDIDQGSVGINPFGDES
jgi:uncharacterized protein YlxW (UPF0749 family)